MNWTLVDLGGGYRQIIGAVYDCFIAVVDEVTETEHPTFRRHRADRRQEHPTFSKAR
jgi:hypothetical protein